MSSRASRSSSARAAPARRAAAALSAAFCASSIIRSTSRAGRMAPPRPVPPSPPLLLPSLQLPLPLQASIFTMALTAMALRESSLSLLESVSWSCMGAEEAARKGGQALSRGKRDGGLFVGMVGWGGISSLVERCKSLASGSPGGLAQGPLGKPFKWLELEWAVAGDAEAEEGVGRRGARLPLGPQAAAGRVEDAWWQRISGDAWWRRGGGCVRATSPRFSLSAWAECETRSRPGWARPGSEAWSRSVRASSGSAAGWE